MTTQGYSPASYATFAEHRAKDHSCTIKVIAGSPWDHICNSYIAKAAVTAGTVGDGLDNISFS